MSDLEAEMQPILRAFLKGEPHRMQLDDQLTVARWATLKAYVLDSGFRSMPPVVTRSTTLSFRRTQTPSPDTRIRIATVDYCNTLSAHHVAVHLESAPPGSLTSPAFCTTFVLGHAVIQVAGRHGSEFSWIRLGPIIVDGWVSLLPLVPEGFNWPTSHSLTRADVDDAASELLRVANRT